MMMAATNHKQKTRMPELPELETIVRGLRPSLPGRRVVGARLRYRALYRRGSLPLTRLVGRRFTAVERIGKNALFRFDPASLMVVNLGMTGRLLVCRRDEKPIDPPRKHLHGRIVLDDRKELRYYDARRFGHIYVAESCDFAADLNIGPDPFEGRPAYLRDRLDHRTAPIKSLLLDQRILSGIGNIYADELLFHAGIHPLTPGGDVAARSRVLLGSARVVLERAIAHGGSTVRDFGDYRRSDGSRGDFQRYHAVYGREGEACYECGIGIEKIVVGGRGTHYCPRCQGRRPR